VKRPAAAPRRVLIIKPSALGDVVTALPVLRGLRRSFPQAHLAWLVQAPYAPLIDRDADLDEAVLFERRRLGRAWRSPSAAAALGGMLRRLRRARYDWAIDLQGLLRSGLFAAATAAPVRAGFADAREGAAAAYTHRLRPRAAHTVDRNIELARALGVDARPEDLDLAVPPAGRRAAAALLAEANLPRGRFVACVPPTRWATKRYPPRQWRRVVDGLSRLAPVALLGTAADRALCAHVAAGGDDRVANLAGRTPVAALAGVIEAAGAVVCCDSAASFIAAAVGTPAAVLIGPTRPQRTGPYGGRGEALVADVPCQGCLKRRCRHVTCMASIDPSAVVAAAERMLSGGAPLCRTVSSSES
jgi:lipopolysaccharide heptosyltransferase I